MSQNDPIYRDQPGPRRGHGTIWDHERGSVTPRTYVLDVTTTARQHKVIRLPGGRRLSWVEEYGPRGRFITNRRLDGEPVDTSTFIRLKLWAERGVSPSL